MSKAFLIACLFCISITACSDNGWQGKYRYPGEKDFDSSWEYYRNQIPEPYHIQADFDGDGRMDDAWILVSKSGPGWTVIAFMNKEGGVREISLETSKGGMAQIMGLKVIQAGTYQTACGKGYGHVCGKDEPSEITIIHPAIELFQYEGPASIFYWDDSTSQFKRVWISD